MEKQPDGKQYKSCRRLLIVLLILQLSCSLYAAKVTAKKSTPKSQNIRQPIANPYANLQISLSEKKTYITETEVVYFIQIPNVKSSNVQLRFPEFPATVKFQSMKKNDIVDEEGNTLCEVEIVFEFLEKGIYNLPAVTFIINHRQYRFKFETVEILENPFYLNPQVIIKISKNKDTIFSYATEKSTVQNYSRNSENKKINLESGENYKFSVYLKNVNQIQSFSWELPKDAIFTSKNEWQKQVEVINQTGKKITKAFNNQDYSYYSELDKEVLLSEFNWTVLKEGENEFPKIKAAVSSYNDIKTEIIFSDIPVFAKKYSRKSSTKSTEDKYFADAFINEEEAAVKFNKAISIEKAEEIAASLADEYKADKTKRKLIKKGLLGINTSTHMYSIPEETASKVYEINGGQQVRILEQTEEWFYIGAVDTPEKTGWCKKDTIVILK